MLFKQFGKDTYSSLPSYKSYQTQDTKEMLLVDKKYQVVKSIGSGATSVVVKAVNTKSSSSSNNDVAIKKINRVFEHTVMAHRAMREMRILRCLKPHDNIIQIREIMLPSDPQSFNELYVVTDYMETDLHDIIRMNGKIQKAHKQYFLYQLLRGLKYIHSGGVIHRDIKPQNLLVNKALDLKICDFGLATVKHQKINSDYNLTSYVVTRWFRAPELILKYESKNYTSKIDMWSVGCVLAELYMGKVLFGENEIQRQLQRLLSLLGLPPQHIMNKIKDQKVKDFLVSTSKKVIKVSFKELMPYIDDDALDLLTRLLEYDPEKRLSAEQALKHPFFSDLHSEAYEPCADPISYFDFEFEQYTLDKKILRELILDEIMLYHSKEARIYYEQCKRMNPKGLLERIYQKENDEPMIILEDVDTRESSYNNSPESSIKCADL